MQLVCVCVCVCVVRAVWFLLFLLTVCFCLRHGFRTLFYHVLLVARTQRPTFAQRVIILYVTTAQGGKLRLLKVSLKTLRYKWPSALGGIPLNQQFTCFRVCQERAQQRWRPRQTDVVSREPVWCSAVCSSHVEAGRGIEERCCQWKFSSVHSLYWWLQRIAK
jgi:hypothetical protein